MNLRSVLQCGGSPPLSDGGAGSPKAGIRPDEPSSPCESASGLGQSKTCRLWLALCLFLLPSAFCLRAWGQYSIDWSTVDGGGGTSTGGEYSVSGTLGQPESGGMSGGGFTLEGGFWPGVIVPSTGEAPTLFIQAAGDSVIISWSPVSADFALETTGDLTSPTWVPAPAGNPVEIPLVYARQFFRLQER